MEVVVTRYFENLLYSSNPTVEQIEMVTSTIQEHLLTRSKTFLDRLFTLDGIRKTIFDMAPTKALGLYGLSSLFYQENWDIMGGRVTKACFRFLNDKDSLE